MRRSLAALASLALALAAARCSSASPAGSSSAPPAQGDDSGAPSDAGFSPPSDGASTTDAGPLDSSVTAADSASSLDDAGPADGSGCEWGGAPGTCIATAACAAIADHTSYPNECPGPASIECCIVTPDTASNPPVPTGYELMQQAQVTSAMTTWAVTILDDPATYPMFATTTMTFGTQLVLARVEWHPPDFQNSVIHRGVTLYVPI